MVLCSNAQPTRLQLGTLFNSPDPSSPVRSAAGRWAVTTPPCLTQALFTRKEDRSRPIKKLPFVSTGVGKGYRQATGHARWKKEGRPEVIRREGLDASSNQIAGSRTAKRPVRSLEFHFPPLKCWGSYAYCYPEADCVVSQVDHAVGHRRMPRGSIYYPCVHCSDSCGFKTIELTMIMSPNSDSSPSLHTIPPLRAG